jgi:hypothetical protein
MTSPDPVSEAAAYQASLLAALGDDDPAEVRRRPRRPRFARWSTTRARAAPADPARTVP